MARLFVSDVHLDAGAPEATEQFLDFLAREALTAEALYILGDLFESWVGDDERSEAALSVCAALTTCFDVGSGILRVKSSHTVQVS